jgi:hypothetical protein
LTHLATRIRAHPLLAFLASAALFSALALHVLALFYPPAPFGRLPYGPVSFTILFASHPRAPREPILTGGVPGASYIVSVEQAGARHVRFVYESWGWANHLSAPVAVTPGQPYRLTLDMPQLRAPTQERGTLLLIQMNGAEIMHEEIPYLPLAVKSLWIGTNPFIGPYPGRDQIPGPPKPYAFSGQIRDVARPASASLPLSILADRLFPNLRYEVEIAPHIFYWALLFGFTASLCAVFFILPAGPSRPAFLLRLAYYATPLAIAALPILPLLQISRTFRADWLNHGWIMEYYGQFLFAHHWLPRVVQSRQSVGMASPLFYGHFLYAIGGFFSMLAGGDVGLRAALFLSLLLQTLCVRRTVRRLTGNLILADTASALVCWAIYPFSNLYGGSVMEFQAVCYLNCCVCILIDICATPDAQWRPAVELALCFVLTANHPITGMLGALLLAFAAAIAVALHPARWAVALTLAISTGIVLFLLSPWIYMYAQYGQEIYIGRATTTEKLAYYPVDTLLNRFLPFPFDIRSLQIGALSDSSYADMQLNLPLFLAALSGFAFVRVPRKPSKRELCALGLIAVGWSVFAWALAASVNPWIAGLSQGITYRLRYAFRLVNFQNIPLLLILLGWCWLWRLRSHATFHLAWLPAFCSALLAVGAVSMLEKWTHGSVAAQLAAIGHSQDHALTLPYTFYWLMDYVGENEDVTKSPEPKQTAAFPLLQGARFGEVEPLSVDLPDTRLLVLNAIASPPNRFYVDGTLQPPRSVFRDAVHAVLRLGPGKHRIEYRFEPGAAWSLLRVSTEVAFPIFALACFLLPRKRGHPTSSQALFLSNRPVHHKYDFGIAEK